MAPAASPDFLDIYVLPSVAWKTADICRPERQQRERKSILSLACAIA